MMHDEASSLFWRDVPLQLSPGQPGDDATF
jgi:hypothetical protein